MGNIIAYFRKEIDSTSDKVLKMIEMILSVIISQLQSTTVHKNLQFFLLGNVYINRFFGTGTEVN